MTGDLPYRPLLASGRSLPPLRSVESKSMELTAKDGGNFGQGVPAFWFARAIEIGGNSENLYRPFADSVWVQAAIKQVSGPVSSVGVEITLPETAAISKRAKMRWKAPGAKPVSDAMLYDFLNEPSPGMGWEDFVQASIGFLKMSECFWVLDDSANAPFPEARKAMPKIKFARPDRMSPNIMGGVITGWRYTPINGTPETLDVDQVIRLMNWNPYDDYRGLGEYQSASIAAESDWLAGKFSRNLMANNGDLGGIIISKDGVPTDPQREQIIAMLREKRAAQLRGELRYTFMTGDIDVKDPKITSVDAPFISQRLENRHEIAMAFGVPMSRFDVKASYSIGSASDYYQLINDTCIPAGAKLCTALEQVIFRCTGRSVMIVLNWDEHPVLQEVRRERLAAADGLFAKGMPMQTVSEYLGLDLPEYEGWDIGYIPINLTPVGAPESETPKPEDYSETPETDDDSGDAPAPTKSLLAYLRGKIGLQGKASNKSLWQAHMRQRTASVKLYQSRVGKVINDFRVKALRRLGELHRAGKSIETKSILDLIFNPDDFGDQLAKSLTPVTQTVLQAAGAELLAEIGRKDDPWQLPPAKAQMFISQRTQPIKGVGGTIRDQLNTQLKEANEAGETMDQITARVKGVFNNLTNFEARRVAMTETCAAYGFARHEAMTDAGVEYKSWISSHGPHVREAHAEAEAHYEKHPIPVDEPFEVDGEALMYPGDPSGSPGNIINCQCIQIAVMPKEQS